MTDTARLLLLAALLSGLSLGAFAWRLIHVDPSQPQRLIGELRLAQWAAILLAVIAGGWIGVSASSETETLVGLDVAFGVAYGMLSALALVREPRQALLLLALAFVSHALVDIAHRPGWLSPNAAPRWFSVGCAAYNIYVAALCYWARRR